MNLDLERIRAGESPARPIHQPLVKGMTMRFGCTGLLAFIVVMCGSAASALAQDRSWGDIAVSGVGMEYDLSGVGTAPGLAVRGTRDVSEHVVLEVRGLFAQPNQQFGPSTLVVPEAQLQYRWNAARLSPFVGVGGGLAMVKSSFDTNWDPTVSFSAGTGVRLTEQLGLLGEVRLRGVEYRFTGSIAEWAVGLTYRLPAF
jgi:hypothetical protein